MTWMHIPVGLYIEMENGSYYPVCKAIFWISITTGISITMVNKYTRLNMIDMKIVMYIQDMYLMENNLKLQIRPLMLI